MKYKKCNLAIYITTRFISFSRCFLFFKIDLLLLFGIVSFFWEVKCHFIVTYLIKNKFGSIKMGVTCALYVLFLLMILYKSNWYYSTFQLYKNNLHAYKWNRNNISVYIEFIWCDKFYKFRVIWTNTFFFVTLSNITQFYFRESKLIHIYIERIK